MKPTGRGLSVTGAGAALIGAGFALGYPELAVLGCAALAAAACALGYAVWRPRLSVSRTAEPDRVTRGEPSTQILTVRNASRLRAATLIAEDLCGGQRVPVPLIRLRPGQDSTVRYPVPTGRRGVVRIGPLTVTRNDPLDLLGVQQSHGGTSQVWVHPRTHPLTAVPVGIARSLDGRIDRVPHGSITFDALRQYVIGDELRRVHWRTTARIGELMVREYVDTSLPRVVVLLDDRAGAYPTPDGFEDACEAAASVLVAAVREDLSAHLLLVSSSGGAARSGAAAPSGAAALSGGAASSGGADRSGAADPSSAAGQRPAPEQRPTPERHLALGPSAAHRVDARPLLDRLAEAQPTGGGDLDPAIGWLRQYPLGDTLVYLTGSTRAGDLAAVGALRARYPTIVAGVFGDPAEVPSIVEGLHLLAVTDAAEFATAWDGIGRW